MGRRAWVLGAVAVIGMFVVPLASTTPASAATKEGTGSVTCQIGGMIRFSPAWTSGAKGNVTGTVHLSGPAPGGAGSCVMGSGSAPVVKSITVTGKLKFPNGKCGSTNQTFTSKGLKITYEPVVRPTTLSFTPNLLSLSGTGSFGDVGHLTGSYPASGSGEIGSAATVVIGSCSTGITEFSWPDASSTAPGRVQLNI